MIVPGRPVEQAHDALDHGEVCSGGSVPQERDDPVTDPQRQAALQVLIDMLK